MATDTLRPNGTTSNSGTLVGGASAHAILSDDSDSSYVAYNAGNLSLLTLTDLTLPAGAVIKSAVPRARVAKGGGAQPGIRGTVSNAALFSRAGEINPVTWVTPNTVNLTGESSGELSDTAIDGASMEVTNHGSGGTELRVYDVYVEVTDGE